MGGFFNEDNDHVSIPINLDHEIKELTIIILELMPQYDGWVPWRKVAKALKGSEEFSCTLSAMAEIDQYRHLFASNGKVVKLTEAGIRLAKDATGLNQKREHELIADAVRRYAARLERIYIKVHRVSKVARVGKKIVQAFYIDTGDEPILSETPVEIRPIGSGITHGKIVGTEPGGGVLFVALDWEIYDSQLPAILSIDRGFLLHQLAECIQNLSSLPSRFLSVLSKDNSIDLPIADQDSVSIAERIARIPAPWTKFLWGPPALAKLTEWEDWS